MADVNLCSGQSVSNEITEGSLQEGTSAKVNDGVTSGNGWFYGAGAGSPCNVSYEIVFSGSASVSSVKSYGALGSNSTWDGNASYKAYLYYSGAYNEVANHSGRQIAGPWEDTGSWSGVTKVKYEFSSAGPDKGSYLQIWETEVW